MPSPGVPRSSTRKFGLSGGVRLGSHMSIAGGLDLAPLRGRQVGCDTIQVFTKSNRQWRAKRLSDQEVEAFKANLAATGIGPVVAHDCYLVNLAAPRKTVRHRSVVAFRIELERAERLGIPYLVTHPGSHAGAGEAEGIRRMPMILETPTDDDFVTADRRNLARLRRLVNGKDGRGGTS